MTVRRRTPTFLALSLLLVQLGCAVNPATGRREFMLVSEGQEIAMGREADPQISGMFGLYPDSQVQRYVRGLGDRLARLSERPNLPWTFRVLDDPTINAFALPGGYNYVTRGIMAYLDSEAELVSVIGHEIGHVTARHGAHQMSQQQLAQVGLVAGVILLPENLQPLAGLAAVGSQLLFLKFSRDDENEADMLGLRYMAAARYAPQEMPKVYAMLNEVGGGSGGGLPTWLSTHPNPEDREQRITQLIANLPRPLGNTIARDEYLTHLNGMTYGENPREGFFKGPLFQHPDMAFQLEFPAEWKTANQRSAVLAQSPREDAMMQLTLAEGSSPRAAADAFRRADGVQAGAVTTQTINGFESASVEFQVATQNGTLAGAATFVGFDGQVLRILGYSGGTQWTGYRSVVRTSVASFNRLTDAAALAVKPLRVEIVTADRQMTIQQFAVRFPSQVSLEQLARLNRRPLGETIPTGTKLKRIVGGPLP